MNMQPDDAEPRGWQADTKLVRKLKETKPHAVWEESSVPTYTLPPLLESEVDGGGTDFDHWMRVRRPELLGLFRTHVYGRAPDEAGSVGIELLEENDSALDGQAIRRQVRLRFLPEPEEASLELLLYLPAKRSGPVPLFMGLNFFGNQSVQPDPDIRISRRWMRRKKGAPVDENHRATEASRGHSASRWPVREILRRGYGVATAYYGDLVPDHAEGLQEGLPGFFGGGDAPDAWGAISAWAWGLQRIMDYAEGVDEIDTHRVAVVGHSRLGKTALWAGAQDERFALVISNNSGCGGAALSRRRFGETVRHITTRFPHWFCENFKAFADREHALPVDQHQLLALMAPRALYVASADEDVWCDPRGEFQALAHASEVYALAGDPGFDPDPMPPMDIPMHLPRQGYHIRRGPHGITSYDWQRYMDFADRFYSGRGR